MYITCIKRKKLLIIISIVIAIVFILISLLTMGIKNVFLTFKDNRLLPIYSVQTEENKLAISFDCAWGTDYTDFLLKTMQEENVRCTFFAVEFWTKKHPEYVKKISDSGHEIGTHSATHPYMSKLSREDIVKELTTSSKAIENITGKKVNLFRPPYGDYNNNLIKVASELNLYTIQWDIDSLDWKNLSEEEIYNRVIKKAHNGAIVLFHNQGLNTYKALPKIIIKLKEMGYQIVPIGELIYRENYSILPNGTQIKNS